MTKLSICFYKDANQNIWAADVLDIRIDFQINLYSEWDVTDLIIFNFYLTQRAHFLFRSQNMKINEFLGVHSQIILIDQLLIPGISVCSACRLIVKGNRFLQFQIYCNLFMLCACACARGRLRLG